MAIQTLPGPFEFPLAPDAINATPTLASGSTTLIDAATESIGFLLCIPKSGNIHKVGFRTGTVTTGCTVDARLETHSLTTGFPTGTLAGTNTNAAVAIANGDSNTAFTAALTGDLAVVKGELYWLVIVNNATPGNLNIGMFTDDAASAAAAGPPGAAQFTSSWAMVSTTGAPICWLEYDDGTYAGMPHCWPIGTTGFTTTAVSTGTTPDEIGASFSFPFPVSVTGAWLWADFDGDCNIILYGADGVTVLGTIAVDKDTPGAGTAGMPQWVYFSTSISLLANTTYRLVYAPSSATALNVYDLTTPSAAAMNQLPMGSHFVYTSAKDPSGTGSWTDVTTRRPMLGLLLDGFSDGAAMLYMPNLEGI